MEQHFDVSRIVGIEIMPLRESHYKWLPTKQKTFLWGIFKLNRWHPEGFYSYGNYTECYESGCFDAHQYTAEELRKHNYIVEEITNTVYEKPRVVIFLEHGYKIHSTFDSDSEASEWVSNMRIVSGKEFEINHMRKS
jgi:hypothetical protein